MTSDAAAAELPELTAGDVYVYAHGNGGIFVLDAARRSESMTLEDVLLLAVSCRAAGDRVVAGWDPTPIAVDVIDRLRAMGAEFVEFGADPPQTWKSGATAMMEAASNGSQRILDDLIARGAAIDERDESGSAALHHAANKGHVQAIESLIAAGADRDRPNLIGLTPYRLAISSGHAAAASRLAALGASTAEGPTGDLRFSRLHYAVMYVWVFLALVLAATVVPLTWASAGWPLAAVALVAIALVYRLVWPRAFWAGGVPRRMRGSMLTVRRLSGRSAEIDLSQVTIAGLGGSPTHRSQRPRWVLLAHPDGHPVTPRALRRIQVPAEEVDQLIARGDRHVVVLLDGTHADEVVLPVGNVLAGRAVEMTPSLHHQLTIARTRSWSDASTAERVR